MRLYVYLIFTCVIALANSANAVPTRSGPDYVGRAAYIDKAGKPVLPFSKELSGNVFVDRCGIMSEGWAPVRVRVNLDNDGVWGFATRRREEHFTDSLLITPQYVNVKSFSEGLAAVQISEWLNKNGQRVSRWGFINKNGHMMIEPQYSEVWSFHEGLARVLIADSYDYPISFEPGPIWTNPRYGFVDRIGQRVVDTKYVDAGDFADGLAPVGVLNTAPDQSQKIKYGYIDRTGHMVIEPKFYAARGFSQGFAAVAVSENGKRQWGFIDKKGSLVIKADYLEVGDFSEGLAWVAAGRNYNDLTYGYIDRSGNIIIKPRFVEARDFSEGLAPVRGYIKRWGRIIHTTMEPDYVGWIYDSYWGYIDKTGKTVIKPKFIEASYFFDGRAAVSTGYANWTYIDRSGRPISKQRYSKAGDFCEGVAGVIR